MSFSRVAIIFNPNATGDALKQAAQLRADLARALPSLPVEMLETKRAGHAEQLAREFSQGHGPKLCVSVSGDGGYHEVINGVLDSGNPEATAAVVPAGNANDHHADVARQPLIEAIAAGLPGHLDVLEITIGKKTRYAHSYAGLGVTPAVALELNRHKLHPLRELMIVFKTLRSFKPFSIRVGDHEDHLDSLVAANIGRMAKLFKTGARPDDGYFDLFAIRPATPLAQLGEALRLVTVGPRHAQRLQEFRFTAITGMPMQLDGEVYDLAAGTSVTILCKHHGLRSVF